MSTFQRWMRKYYGSIEISPKLRQMFMDYANDHRSPENVICHQIGIPVIFFSTLGLLSGIELPWGIHGGLILWAFASVWYFTMDRKLTPSFSLVAFIAMTLARPFPASILWTLFIGGWIVQFIGHYKYEKNQPAFFKNVFQLLIGPLWIYAKWTKPGWRGPAQ